MVYEYRASKITIEIPKPDSEPWVHLAINKLEVDDNGTLINTYPMFAYISKPLSQVGMEMFSFLDPVYQSDVTVSGYGLAKAITSYVEKNIEEKFGEGTFHD